MAGPFCLGGKKVPFPFLFFAILPVLPLLCSLKKSSAVSSPPRRKSDPWKSGIQTVGGRYPKAGAPKSPLARMGRLTPNNFFLLRFPRLPPTDPMARGKKSLFIYTSPRGGVTPVPSYGHLGPLKNQFSEVETKFSREVQEKQEAARGLRIRNKGCLRYPSKIRKV